MPPIGSFFPKSASLIKVAASRPAGEIVRDEDKELLDKEAIGPGEVGPVGSVITTNFPTISQYLAANQGRGLDLANSVGAQGGDGSVEGRQKGRDIAKGLYAGDPGSASAFLSGSEGERMLDSSILSRTPWIPSLVYNPEAVSANSAASVARAKQSSPLFGAGPVFPRVQGVLAAPMARDPEQERINKLRQRQYDLSIKYGR
jgi:hypothetical protein